MGVLVVTGAKLMCIFGSAPSTLNATSQTSVIVDGKPAATIKDMQPGANIPPFGMCISMANPQVAAATSAALGVLTPQPCTMAPMGTWTPANPKCITGGAPCLSTGASLQCAMGMGSISVVYPGQMKVLG